MKIGRALKIVVVVAVVAIIGVVAGVIFFVDRIAREGIERGGTFALGVPTTLSSASIGVLRGNFALAGLDVANPPGFERDKYFLRLGTGGLDVSMASLTKDVIDVPKLELDDVSVALLKGDKGSNYKIILDNLARLKPGQPANTAEGQGKKFVVHEIVIRRIKVKVDVLGAPIGLSAAEVAVDEVKITNVGTGATGPVEMPQIAGVVMQSILASAVAHGGGLLPKDIAGDLAGQLGSLKNLGGDNVKIVSQLGGQVADVTKGLTEGLDSAIKDVSKDAESVLGGVKDLLGKPKKDDKKGGGK